jgi:signal transduction histidine kinase
MNEAIVAAENARDQKSSFMAFLCHELRNPLHAVLSMSGFLQESSLDPDQAESVFTIHASSELMLAITNVRTQIRQK